MEDEILKLIQKNKRNFTKAKQRAELLRRNNIFLREVRALRKRFGKPFFEIKNLAPPVYPPYMALDQKRIKLLLKRMKIFGEESSENILLKLDYPKVKIINSWEDVSTIENVHTSTLFYGDWNNLEDIFVSIEDDSFFKEPDLDTIVVHGLEPERNLQAKIACKLFVLNRYMTRWVEFCDKWHIKTKWDGKLSTLAKYQRELISIEYDIKGNINLPIVIRIGPWTTFEDIKINHQKIEEMQKSLKLKKEEGSSNFGRDLCWVDLNRAGFSPGKIAKIWIKHCPLDIDLLVIKRIKRKESALRDEDDIELLTEIKNDDSLGDLNRQFRQEREAYIEGPYSPFIDLIKKSIRRIEDRIARVSISAIRTYLPDYIPSWETDWEK